MPDYVFFFIKDRGESIDNIIQNISSNQIYNNKNNHTFNSLILDEYDLIQTKPSFYPNWNSCFDCHLYNGRAIQILIKSHNFRYDEILGECTVSAESLANKSREKLITYDWVCVYLCPFRRLLIIV
jgi:hypothetical protein